MKYIVLDLCKGNIFATVLGDNGKIISRANISSKRERYQPLPFFSLIKN